MAGEEAFARQRLRDPEASAGLHTDYFPYNAEKERREI
jgi:hypothetical protein